jgi:predicted transcriptional regulator of viral defense system
MDVKSDRNKMTGISPKETELIATISEKGLSIFTLEDAVRLLNDNKRSVSRLVSSLVRKRKLQRIEKAKYLLIPPMAWKRGEFSEQGAVIATQLIEPYYLSYWTALDIYGWTEQPSQTIFIATTKQKASLKVQGMTFKFVRLKPKRFFGYRERWNGPHKVTVADMEKTIVDCLDQPRYCGEIVEAVKGIWNGRDEIDFSKTLTYAVRMNNGAIIKRLGYIMETLEILTPEFRNKLVSRISRGFVNLDPGGPKTQSKLVPEWQIRLNVNPKNLTEWIRH